MKKIFLIMIVVLFIFSDKNLFAANVRTKIIVNNPTFDSSAAIAPLTYYGNSSMNALGCEFAGSYIYKDIGAAHISGGLTYIADEQLIGDVDEQMLGNYSGRRISGEFAITYFLYKNYYIKEVPSQIGSAMDGNTQISYYVNLDTKVKTFAGPRGGIIYEYSNISYDYIDFTVIDPVVKNEKNNGIQIFMGLNGWTMIDIVFNLLDKKLVNRFGKKHRSANLSNYYADLIIDPLNTTSFTNLGYRLGFKTETENHWHMKFEFGRSPMLGFYGTIGLGIGILIQK